MPAEWTSQFAFAVVLLSAFAALASSKIDTKAWYYSCHDQAPECPQLVSNGSCVGMRTDPQTGYYGIDMRLGCMMATRCPASCKKYMRKKANWLDEEYVDFYERVSAETYTDIFGYAFAVCDLRQGFTFEARQTFVCSDQFARDISVLADGEPGPEKHTKTGFLKTRVPHHLWQRIKAFHANITEDQWKTEPCSEGMHNCYEFSDDGYECHVKNRTTLQIFHTHAHGDELNDAIVDELQPMAEEWAQLKLNITTIYGIRRYLRGGWMSNHVDHVETHVISVIINVAQDVDEPWPLNIVDHYGKAHKIVMEPGDMVWYESARSPHGRVEHFRGRHYDNLFVHFHPRWYHFVPKTQILSTRRRDVQAQHPDSDVFRFP